MVSDKISIEVVLFSHYIELNLAKERDGLSTLHLQLMGLFPRCVLVETSPLASLSSLPISFLPSLSVTTYLTHMHRLDQVRVSYCFLSHRMASVKGLE